MPHSAAPPQIPGFSIPNPQLAQLKQEVANLLERDSPRFPGAQPVSFAREHVAELQRAEYFMCEKTDGIRCLLFLHWRDNGQTLEPWTTLIDRKNNYYDVQPPIRVPYFQNPDRPEQFLFATILDGELVHDVYPEEPKPRLVFYAFDCLAIDGENLMPRTLDKRLGKMKEQVFRPYDNYWMSRHQKPPAKPFVLKAKDSFPSYHVKIMFDNILPSLRHGNDGLIFTCKNTPYQSGTDTHILKWKPPHENTIDFKLKLGAFPTFDPEDGEEGVIEDFDAMPSHFELHVLHNNNVYQRFESDLSVSPQEWETLKSLGERLDGRILECYREVSGAWRYKREDDGTPRWRDDKKDANHISTVLSVLDSIQNPVTGEDLIGVEARVKQAVYKLREEERRGAGAGAGAGGAQQPQQQWQNGQVERDAKKRKISHVDSNGGGEQSQSSH